MSNLHRADLATARPARPAHHRARGIPRAAANASLRWRRLDATPRPDASDPPASRALRPDDQTTVAAARRHVTSDQRPTTLTSATNRTSRSGRPSHRRLHERAFHHRRHLLSNLIAALHEQLVVQAQHDLGTDRRRPSPHRHRPHLEELGGGALDQCVSCESASRRGQRSAHDRYRPPPNRRPTSEPVARQACTRPRPPVRQRPPSPRPPSPSDRRARDRAMPAPTYRSSPRTSPPTQPPWPSPASRAAGSRPADTGRPLGSPRSAPHRPTPLRGSAARSDQGRPAPTRTRPRQRQPSRRSAGRLCNPDEAVMPACRTVAARPRTPQPPAGHVLVEPAVPERGRDPLGLAPRQQRLHDGMRAAMLFELTRPRVRHVDPDAPQHRAYIGRVPQVDPGSGPEMLQDEVDPAPAATVPRRHPPPGRARSRSR